MAATGTPTPNIGLRIPLGTDPASVDDINYNSNLIDTKLGAVGNDSVQDQLNDLNSKITWTRKANLVTSGAYIIPASASLVLVEVRNTSGGTTFASLVLQADYLPQVFVVYGGSGNQATLSVSGRDISISSIDTGKAVCIYYMG